MSTFFSFLAKFAPRAARTSTAPNSWAVVSLWRRVFTLKEEEYNETVEILQECLEQHEIDKQRDPIASSFAVEARQDFLRSIALRNNNNHTIIGSPSVFSSSSSSSRPTSNTTSERQQQDGAGSLSTLTRQERHVIHERALHEPNLQVNLGNVNPLYLPQ